MHACSGKLHHNNWHRTVGNLNLPERFFSRGSHRASYDVASFQTVNYEVNNTNLNRKIALYISFSNFGGKRNRRRLLVCLYVYCVNKITRKVKPINWFSKGRLLQLQRRYHAQSYSLEWSKGGNPVNGIYNLDIRKKRSKRFDQLFGFPIPVCRGLDLERSLTICHGRCERAPTVFAFLPTLT